MKFSDGNHQAAKFLRQAVPLMVKHNISPNPLNYALWYTYVSDRVPELNTQLDKTITTYGTCPTMLSEQLFREHLISDEVKETERVQASLIDLMNGMHKATDAAARETEIFNITLDESLDMLEHPDTSGETIPLESIIRALAIHTQSMHQTTMDLQKQIDSAQNRIKLLSDELNKTHQNTRIDPLTTLFSRLALNIELEQVCSSDNLNITASFLLIDIDNFDDFNKNHGHLMGDRILQYIGNVLKDDCPEPMLPVRFSGKSFAVLMPGVVLADATELAEKVREKIQSIRIKQKASGKVISSITASIGISQLHNSDSADDLIERTEQAVAQAKQSGRNCVISSL